MQVRSRLGSHAVLVSHCCCDNLLRIVWQKITQMYLWLWRSEACSGNLMGQNGDAGRAHAPPGGPGGEFMSLPFLGSRGCLLFLAPGPLLCLQSSSRHLSLTLCGLPTFSPPGSGVELRGAALDRNHFPPTGYLQSSCSQSNHVRTMEKPRQSGPCHFSIFHLLQSLPGPAL